MLTIANVINTVHRLTAVGRFFFGCSVASNANPTAMIPPSPIPDTTRDSTSCKEEFEVAPITPPANASQFAIVNNFLLPSLSPNDPKGTTVTVCARAEEIMIKV